MLVEGIAMQQSLRGLFQCAESYYKIRYKIYQQQLPRGQTHILLNDDSPDKQYYRCNDNPQLATPAMLVMMLVMMLVFTALIAMMMFV
jgi:hypothetical protein